MDLESNAHSIVVTDLDVTTTVSPFAKRPTHYDVELQTSSEKIFFRFFFLISRLTSVDVETMKVIEVKDAVKKYRSGKETNLVLDGFSMSVERGTM
jgi:hypothetical protein